MAKLKSIHKRSQTNFRYIHDAPCIQHASEVMCGELNNNAFKIYRCSLVEMYKW